MPQVTPRATILYSSDDPTYHDPKRNAQYDALFYRDLLVVEEIKEGGHVDVVFQSEKYLEPIEWVLDTIWWNGKKKK